jgi:hypothetical protein
MVIIFLLSEFASPSPSFSNLHIDIGRLQWTRKQRILNGDLIKARKKVVGFGYDSDSVDSDGVDRIE